MYYLFYKLILIPSPAPSPPRMLTNVTMIGEPTGIIIELNWLPPVHPNGAIHYEIEYEPAITAGDQVNAENSSSIPYFTLTLPNEFLTYSVSVVAKNTQGEARSNNIIIQTEKGMYIHTYNTYTCEHGNH